MIFKKIKSVYGFYQRNVWRGRNNGFKFEIYDAGTRFTVSIRHSKKDIRFNTGWQEEIQLNHLDEAIAFCDDFEYKNYKCLGKDL